MGDVISTRCCHHLAASQRTDCHQPLGKATEGQLDHADSDVRRKRPDRKRSPGRLMRADATHASLLTFSVSVQEDNGSVDH